MWLRQNYFFVEKYKLLMFIDILETKTLVSLCILFLNQKDFSSSSLLNNIYTFHLMYSFFLTIFFAVL